MEMNKYIIKCTILDSGLRKMNQTCNLFAMWHLVLGMGSYEQFSIEEIS